MRYWLWLYFPPEKGEAVEATLTPWRRWGSSTGSGTDFRESDISWEYRSLETAVRKADEMHAELKAARVPHRLEIVDTGNDEHDVIARIGRWRGQSPRKRKSKKKKVLH